MADIVPKAGLFPVEVYQGYSNEDVPPNIMYGQSYWYNSAGFSFVPTYSDVPAIGLGVGVTGIPPFVAQFPQQDGRTYYDLTYSDGDYSDVGGGYGRFGGRVWAAFNFEYVVEDPNYRYLRFDYKVSQDISNDDYGQGTLTFQRRNGNTVTFTMPSSNYPPNTWNDAPRTLRPIAGTSEWCLFHGSIWNSVGTSPTQNEYVGYSFCVKVYADTTKPVEAYWMFDLPPVESPNTTPYAYLDDWWRRQSFGTIHSIEEGEDVFYTLLHLVQYNTHTPSVPATTEYRLYRWKPVDDMVDLDFSYKVLELSDADDNAGWNRTSDYSTGFVNGSRTTINGANKMFIFTGGDGSGSVKWYMAPHDFSTYYELTPQGLDDKSETALEQGDIYQSIGYDKDSRPMVTARMAYPWYQEVILGISELPPPPTSGDVFLRSWTYTIDGHDFYVLRLGKQSVLVYDTYSKQWSEFASPESAVWSLNTGTNWPGSIGAVDGSGNSFGSTVVVGDDTTGDLYFLDPEKVDDDLPGGADSAFFERVATTQVSHRGRTPISCDVVSLTGDYRGGETLSVTLEYSDNEGASYRNAGSLNGHPFDYEKDWNWRSLGKITQPGRVFKITDNGLFARLDGLEINYYGGET